MDIVEKRINLVVLIPNNEVASSLTKVAARFNLENPGVSIMYKEVEANEYYNTLITKTLAGDSDFDIFFINSNEISYFIKNNAMESLSKYQAIEGSFKDMFEGIKNMCTAENIIFGVPIWMSNSDSVYAINMELIDSLNIELSSYDWTWEEFADIANTVCKDRRFYMMKNTREEFWLFCMQLITDGIYMDKVYSILSYDADKLAERLEFTKKLYDNNIILDYQRFEGRDNEDNILLQLAFIPSPEMNNEKIMPLPVFEKEVSYPFNVNYLCVNKISKNKENAAEFLSMCISKQAQANNEITSMPVLYKDKSLYENSIYKEFIMDDWNYEVYSYLLKHSRRLETLRFFSHIREYFIEFDDETLTSRDTSLKMIQKMRMILEE